MSLRGQVFAGLLSRAVCALRPKRLPRCVPRTFVLGPKEGLTPLFWCLDGEAGGPLRRGRSRCLCLRFERPLRSGLVLGVRREKNTKGRCQKEPYVQEGEPAKPFSGPYHKSLAHYIMFWILLSRRNFVLEIDFQSLFLFFSYIITNLRFGCQIFLSSKTLLNPTWKKDWYSLFQDGNQSEPLRQAFYHASSEERGERLEDALPSLRERCHLGRDPLPRTFYIISYPRFYCQEEILFSERTFSFFSLLLDYIIAYIPSSWQTLFWD
jgi:hypothetical protein